MAPPVEYALKKRRNSGLRTIIAPQGWFVPRTCFLCSSRTISGLILPGVDHKWKSGVGGAATFERADITITLGIYLHSLHYLDYSNPPLFCYIRQSEPEIV